MSPRTTTLHLQFSARDIPAVAIELGRVQLEGVLIDSGSTCNVIDKDMWEVLKKKKIKCTSWKSNKKLYSYGSEEPLNTAGEFESELYQKIDNVLHVLLLWKRRQGLYSGDRPLNCWQY